MINLALEQMSFQKFNPLLFTELPRIFIYGKFHTYEVCGFRFENIVGIKLTKLYLFDSLLLFSNNGRFIQEFRLSYVKYFFDLVHVVKESQKSHFDVNPQMKSLNGAYF